jgi:hypothetical protein
MNKHDREAWASCATLADVGDCTADWLTGGLEETPGHCAPPDPETTPYVMLLCAVNRRGFVTTGMDDGDLCSYTRWPWGPSVDGLIRPGRLPRLAGICEAHGVLAEILPRRTRRETIIWYRGMVQDSAYAEMRAARCVIVADPVCGRTGRDSPLWPALKEFARRG